VIWVSLGVVLRLRLVAIEIILLKWLLLLVWMRLSNDVVAIHILFLLVEVLFIHDIVIVKLS